MNGLYFVFPPVEKKANRKADPEVVMEKLLQKEREKDRKSITCTMYIKQKEVKRLKRNDLHNRVKCSHKPEQNQEYKEVQGIAVKYGEGSCLSISYLILLF